MIQSGDFLILKVLAVPLAKNKAKFSVVVSGKVAPLAVRRNYLKRRVRAVLAKNKEKLGAELKTDRSFAFIYRKDPGVIPFSLLEKRVLSLLHL